MKTSKDKKIQEMVQYWIETAEQEAINHYAQYKMEQWYYNQSDKEINDFYANHIEQLKKDMVESLARAPEVDLW